MKEKQRTHLTPEEVQEFLSYGVDFGETSCAYNLYEDGYASLALRGYGLGKIVKIIPAPNLQEVLEVLPKTLPSDHCKDAINILYISWSPNYSVWFVGYRISGSKNMIAFGEDNLLVSTINLLRWVCKNHPETLTKTE